jgi:hypothetical protein
MSSAIEKIHNAARDCQSHLLDELVFVAGSVGVPYFEGRHTCSVCMDVPLAAVGGLGHGNFFKSILPSWREASYWLHGKSWGDEVFQYFEAPLKDNRFPAPDAAGELTFKTVGGLVVCTNGNHRLVAAKSWLVNKFGDQATLRSAQVNCYALDESMQKMAVEALQKKCSLAITTAGFDLHHLRIDGHRPTFFVRLGASSFFAKTAAGLVLVDSKIESGSWLARFFYRERDLASCIWTEVPPLALEKMLDSDWMGGGSLGNQR